MGLAELSNFLVVAFLFCHLNLLPQSFELFSNLFLFISQLQVVVLLELLDLLVRSSFQLSHFLIFLLLQLLFEFCQLFVCFFFCLLSQLFFFGYFSLLPLLLFLLDLGFILLQYLLFAQFEVALNFLDRLLELLLEQESLFFDLLLGLSSDQRVFRFVQESGLLDAQLGIFSFLEFFPKMFVKRVIVYDLTGHCVAVVNLVVVVAVRFPRLWHRSFQLKITSTA